MKPRIVVMDARKDGEGGGRIHQLRIFLVGDESEIKGSLNKMVESLAGAQGYKSEEGWLLGYMSVPLGMVLQHYKSNLTMSPTAKLFLVATYGLRNNGHMSTTPHLYLAYDKQQAMEAADQRAKDFVRSQDEYVYSHLCEELAVLLDDMVICN